jgi:hypothetical protein
MSITEKRLRNIIRNIIKEQHLNEMMDIHGLNMHDMRGAAAHGSFFDRKVPKDKREAEKLIRQGLLKIYEINKDLTPKFALFLFPIIGAELTDSLPAGVVLSLGAYLLSLYTNKKILKRLGFEKIDTAGEINTTITYLNEKGYKVVEYIPEKAIDAVLEIERVRAVLDQQGY